VYGLDVEVPAIGKNRTNFFCGISQQKDFVERVHAEENCVLSKHRLFNSHRIHKNAVVGSEEHKQNMECMAEEVCSCIQSATFNRKYLLYFRGIKTKDFLFDDEEKLVTFLSLSEQAKQDFTDTYKVKYGKLLSELNTVWGVNPDFTGDY